MKEVYNERHIGLVFKPILLSINPELSTNSVRNYLSDIRHFMGWYANHAQESGLVNTSAAHAFSQASITSYEKNMIEAGVASSTLRRRLSTVNLIQNHIHTHNIPKDAQPIINAEVREILSNTTPTLEPSFGSSKKTETTTSTITKPAPRNFAPPSDFYLGHKKGPKNNNLKWSHVFGLIGLAFTISLISFGLVEQSVELKVRPYQQGGATANISAASPSARPILFQGVLRDSVGNPIVDEKKIQFKIYARTTGGTALYESGICRLRPTIQGKLRAYIGAEKDDQVTNTCGNPIPQDLIASNRELYLGITVGADAEMLPRQPLANTQLSTNALKIDGYGIGSGANSIPYIQNDGSITLSNPTSQIVATDPDGTFAIGGASALLLSSGFLKDIQFEATQSGNIRFKAGSTTHDQMVIAKNGNVGINTSTPNMFQLEISGSIGPSIRGAYNLGSASRSWDTLFTNKVCFTTEDYCISKESLPGLSIQTADVAEMYPTETSSSIGDVMSLGPDLITTTTGEQIRSLIKARDENNQHLIGVIANNTDRRIIVGQNIAAKDNPQAIALKGRIPVKIDPSSVAIEPGDYLSTSSLAGHATKAVRSGIMIGRAISSWKPNAGQQTVMVYIDTSYATIERSPFQTIAKEMRTFDLFTRTVTTEHILSPIIETDTLTAQTISSTKITADSIQAQTATISGVLTADTVEAKNIKALAEKIQQAVDKTGSLEESASKQVSDNKDALSRINEIQQSLGQLTTTADSTPSSIDSVASTTTPLLLSNLTITETASVFNLHVGGTIQALADELKINALSTISFMNDAVRIAQNGDVVTQGSIQATKGVRTNLLQPISHDDDVSVQLQGNQAMLIQQSPSETPSAKIAADGAATFASLGLRGEASASAVLDPIDTLAQHGLYAPGIDAQSSSVGVGTIPTGEQEVVIFSDQMRNGSKVFLTTITSTDLSPTVSTTRICDDTDGETCRAYFLVNIPHALTAPLSFNWLIVQTAP